MDLPLVFGYKTAGVGNLYRVSAFTWSSTTILPESIPLTLGSIFGQPNNPPPDEVSAVWLHPFPVNYEVSRITVDIVRWTNININGNGRVVIVTKAE